MSLEPLAQNDLDVTIKLDDGSSISMYFFFDNGSVTSIANQGEKKILKLTKEEVQMLVELFDEKLLVFYEKDSINNDLEEELRYTIRYRKRTADIPIEYFYLFDKNHSQPTQELLFFIESIVNKYIN